MTHLKYAFPLFATLRLSQKLVPHWDDGEQQHKVLGQSLGWTIDRFLEVCVFDFACFQSIWAGQIVSSSSQLCASRGLKLDETEISIENRGTFLAMTKRGKRLKTATNWSLRRSLEQLSNQQSHQHHEINSTRRFNPRTENILDLRDDLKRPFRQTNHQWPQQPLYAADSQDRNQQMPLGMVSSNSLWIEP